MPIISFAPDGGVEFTRSNTTLAFFEGEKVSVKRMSEVLHDEASQLYYVKLLTGPHAGRCIGQRLVAQIAEAGGHGANMDGFTFADLIDVETEKCVHGLDTYERAVALEVMIIDLMRVVYGQTMHA